MAMSKSEKSLKKTKQAKMMDFLWRRTVVGGQEK